MDIKLGKLRQWAGDVISSRDKSGLNDEFRDLEKDIELRKEGITRLIVASHAYQHALSKRKTSEAVTDGDKFLPIDTLGIVMIQHGEQFGDESTFGSALTKLGSAHCKIATIQEAYALTFKDTFLASMERFKDEIKECELLRKKLDSRRSASESASTKYEKLQHSKKEKDRREAEDEKERAKQRYEETAEDLRAHMHAIQENEHNQLRELTALIDLETNYIQNYLGVLKDVKADWQDRAPLTSSLSRPRSQSARSIQKFSRSATPRANGNSDQNGRSRAESTTSTDSSEEGDAPKRSGSFRHRRKESNASTKSNKTPSRPSSRLSRRRKDSAASIKVASGGDDKDVEKEKEKKDDKSKRSSMAEWASTAMGSVTGSKNKKNKADKDSFAALEEDGPPGRASSDFGTASSKASSSFLSLSRLTSKAPSNATSTSMPPSFNGSSSLSQATGKILKPPSLQGKKVVKALHDFNGSSDELSFKAGTEIVVVNEVLDDWWMGEVDGRTGLFPTSYTEVVVNTSPISSSSTPSASVSKSPKLPGLRLRRGSSGRRSATSTPKNAPALLPLANEKKIESDSDHNRFLSSDADDDDTRELSQFKPMMTQKSPLFYGGFGNESDSMATTDTGSAVEDSETEDEGRRGSKPGSITLADQRAVKKTSELDDDWVTFEGGSGTGLREQRQQPSDPVQPPTATPKQRTMSLSLLGTLGNSLKIPIVDPAQQPLISRSKSDDPSLATPTTVTDSPITPIGPSASSSNIVPTSRGSPPKKIPPPPPPRRTPSHAPVVSPPVPLRRPGATSNNSHMGAGSLSSSNGSLLGLSGSSLSSSRTSDALGYDRSPFESALELEVEGGSEGGKCDRFRQNPFKPKGMCSNCLQYHD